MVFEGFTRFILTLSIFLEMDRLRLNQCTARYSDFRIDLLIVPSQACCPVACNDFRTRLQRRDHAGLSPASLQDPVKDPRTYNYLL